MGKKKAVKNMSEEIEYRCFIGGLSWSTSDRGLKDAFDKFGKLLEAKVTTPLSCLCAYYFYFFNSFGLNEILFYPLLLLMSMFQIDYGFFFLSLPTEDMCLLV